MTSVRVHWRKPKEDTHTHTQRRGSSTTMMSLRGNFTKIESIIESIFRIVHIMVLWDNAVVFMEFRVNGRGVSSLC